MKAVSAPAGPLSAQLFRLLRTPAASLSEVELRLIRIANELMIGLAIQVRYEGCTDGQNPAPLTPAIVGRVAELAIAAAIAMEKPLRDIRDELEGRS